MIQMKLAYLTNTQCQRVLRKQEERCKRKAKKAEGKRTSNYPYFDDERKTMYATRMSLRIEQRYLHLARAFVKDRDYKSVENQVREGNEVDTHLLTKTLNSWGYFPDKIWVHTWLTDL